MHLKQTYQELAQIHTQEVAMDREENEVGVSCIAMPIFDIHGNVRFSISTAKLHIVGENFLQSSFKQTAAAISHELEYHNNGLQVATP